MHLLVHVLLVTFKAHFLFDKTEFPLSHFFKWKNKKYYKQMLCFPLPSDKLPTSSMCYQTFAFEHQG